MNFKYSTQIRFHHTDLAGISFYANVFPLAHDAYEEFICQVIKMEKSNWFTNPEWIVPIKQTECEFKAPLRPFAQIDIFVNVESCGESAFTLRFDFKDQNILCATVKTTHVFCNKTNFAKQEIPKDIKAKLLAAN